MAMVTFDEQNDKYVITGIEQAGNKKRGFIWQLFLSFLFLIKYTLLIRDLN